MRAAPAEDDVRTQGGVLGIGRWPHAKVAPCPSTEAGSETTRIVGPLRNPLRILSSRPKSRLKATGTVASGWNAGMAEPRTAPEETCEDCEDDEPASVKARLVEIACRESELMVDDRNEP